MDNINREKVLEVIGTARKPLSRAALEERLGVRTSGDFIVFSRILDELEDQCLIFRDRNNAYFTAEQKGYVIGRIRITQQRIGYLSRDASEIRIETENLGNAMNGDRVVVGEGQVLKVLEHALERVTGTWVTKGRRLACVLNDPRTEEIRHRFDLPGSVTPKAGDIMSFRIAEYEQPMILQYERTLGKTSDPDAECEAVLIDCGIRTVYPENVLAEAAGMPQLVEDISGRRDLRQELTVTIDGDDSQDFDDAVGIMRTDDGWRLKVSIADVSWYVKEGSALDREAYLRGCSVYTPVRTEHMLPKELSSGICSLNPQVDRLTITCDMQIGRSGETTSFEVYPSVIRSDERMTYRNTNRLLEHDPEMAERYERYGSFFSDLAECADAVRAYRHDKGAIDFNAPETEIEVNARGYAVDVREKERGHAERMIEDCMIAANVCVARLMNERKIPAVYRVHGEPEYRKLQSFSRISGSFGKPFRASSDPKEIQAYLESVRGSENETLIAEQLLQCMAKAYYDASCLGHFGLAEPYYLHFTSPIRRYPDLIVHRMLRKYVFGGEPDASDVLVTADAALQSSERERAAVDAERKCDDRKAAEYMLSQKGRKFSGVICSVTRFGMYVRLPNTVEGLLSLKSMKDDYYTFNETEKTVSGKRSGKVYRLGDRITVIAADASAEKGTIDFMIEQKPERREQHSRRGGARRGRQYGRKERRR
ncbi:MAG: ribonuclease R [Solobacterium sp.]|nr:ribonuclease R [Solobacterium sp.]